MTFRFRDITFSYIAARHAAGLSQYEPCDGVTPEELDLPIPALAPDRTG